MLRGNLLRKRQLQDVIREPKVVIAIIADAMASAPMSGLVEKRSTANSEIDRVLSSRLFVRSPILQKLLLYLWEHREEEISEYAIAVDALGRHVTFNPATDATVRVNIGRLRQKLRDHYLDDDKDASERLEIPLGSHRVVLVCSAEQTPLVTAPEDSRDEVSVPPAPKHVSPEGELSSFVTSSRRWLLWSIPTGIAVLLLGLAFVLIRHPRSSHNEANAHPLLSLQPWNTIASDRRPLRIIVATPVFFSWQAQGKPSKDQRFLVRDVGVNDFSELDKSAELQGLSHRYGRPLLGQTYTVISDTYASVTLARFLDRNGLGDQSEVLDRAGATLSAIQRDNVIALGTTATLAPFSTDLALMNFALEPGDEKLLNRNPAKGEPALVQAEIESSDRSKWPGIIAVLPGDSPNSVRVLLIGRHTSALATFLTSSSGLDQLASMLRKTGEPRYFEAVVESEMSADRLVSQKLLMVRASHSSRGL